MFLKPNRHTHLSEAIQCVLIFLMTPVYFIFQLCVIRPFLIEHLQWGYLKHLFHIIFGCYLFINVAGNLTLCLLTDSRVKEYRGPGPFCEDCLKKRPMGSWHCKTCDACIIRRDHHCTFLAHCIGRNNQRYYTCFFCHLAISIIYATVYNYIVLDNVFNIGSFAETTAKLFNIGNWSFLQGNMWVIKKRMFVFFWFFNLTILPFAVNLAVFHMYKAFNGLTWHEYKKGRGPVRTHWKRNMQYVFGERWYLAILWPSVDSPLPRKLVVNNRNSYQDI